MHRLILTPLIIFFAACSGQKTDKVALADLMLNQKECYFGQSRGEIINGKYIVNGAFVFLTLEKIDGNRVLMRVSGDTTSVILVLASDSSNVYGGMLNSEPLISCKIN
jgi:hypothetical protein